MLAEALSRMREVFSDAELVAAKRCYEQEHVLTLRLSEGLMMARVKGHAGQIFNVHLDLKKWPGQPARCSCGQRKACEHVAACLLALRAKEQQKKQPVVHEVQAAPVDRWLDELEEKETRLQQEQASHQLVFLLEPRYKTLEDRLVVRLALAKNKKSGDLGRKNLLPNLAQRYRQHFIAEDETLLSELNQHSSLLGSSVMFQIRSSEVLEKILKTGRAFLLDAEDRPLSLQKPQELSYIWQLLPSGQQRLRLMVNEEEIRPLLLDKPWLFDALQAAVCPIASEHSSRQLKYVLNAEPLEIDLNHHSAEHISPQFADFPKPLSFKTFREDMVSPTPRLTFDVITDAEHLKTTYIAIPRFCYSDCCVFADAPFEKLTAQDNETLVYYPRDKEKERDCLKKLSELMPHRRLENRSEMTLKLRGIKSSDDLEHLYQNIIPKLQAEGWQIEYASDLYQEIIDGEKSAWFSSFNEESGQDFFSYHLGISINGNKVDVLPLVLELIERSEHPEEIELQPDDEILRLKINENQQLQCKLGRLKPLIRLVLQMGLRLKGKKSLRLESYQLILLKESEQAFQASLSRWQGAELLAERLLALDDFSTLPKSPLPQGLHAELRDYQQQGLDWLQWLCKNRFGGVLADDMGLGKTIQTLAHLLLEKEQGRLERPALIISPTSLIGNWQQEARRFTPDLKVHVFHGMDRQQDEFADCDLLISTYGLVQRDKSLFLKTRFSFLILDEAQFIKNARTKTTQIIQQLNASHRLCLTGTPLENHLGELWSLFHFLMPGLLGNARQFRQWFRQPIEKGSDEQRAELLKQRIKPFMLRRNKSEVASELPPKTETIQFVELGQKQRDLYEGIRLAMEKKVREAIQLRGLNSSHIILLDALLKLRQVCCDPRLLKMQAAEMAHGHSAKLEAVIDLLKNLLAEGRRVLLFSQFTSMLNLIEEAIKKQGFSYLKLTGQTKNRQQLVNEFQQGDVPIFLISLKAGGTGLNLSQADSVIHYDPWWNPAVEAQASDRSHRLGQEKPVFVYKMIAEGTVEQAILEMQQKKKALFDEILSTSTQPFSGLKEEDILQFFSPFAG